MVGISPTDLALLALGLALAGGAAGLLAGLFGVGGGAVIVPVLYEVFRLLSVPEEARMPLAVGTSLAVIVPTSIRSFRAHRAKGAVDMTILRAWAVPVVAGVLAGAAVAAIAPAALFKAVFVVVATITAIKLLFGKDEWRLARDLPTGPGMAAYGGAIGVLSALMGIGGGQLCNLVMALHGRPIHQSVATASGLGVLISIPGALGYVLAGWSKAAAYPTIVALQPPLALGYVSVLGALLVIPTSMWLAPMGARLAHAWPKRRLEIAFGFFLLAISARFAVSLLPG